MTKEATKYAPARERIEFKAPDDQKHRQPVEMFRRPVPEGWVVAHSWGDSLGPLVFVPDEGHRWDPYAESAIAADEASKGGGE